VPALYRDVGLTQPSVEGFLIAHVSWDDPDGFLRRAAAGFEQVAERHGLQRSAELARLVEVLGLARGEYPADADFYAIATVPVFLISGIRPQP
jgi:hypothetical protein